MASNSSTTCNFWAAFLVSNSTNPVTDEEYVSFIEQLKSDVQKKGLHLNEPIQRIILHSPGSFELQKQILGSIRVKDCRFVLGIFPDDESHCKEVLESLERTSIATYHCAINTMRDMLNLGAQTKRSFKYNQLIEGLVNEVRPKIEKRMKDNGYGNCLNLTIKQEPAAEHINLRQTTNETTNSNGITHEKIEQIAQRFAQLLDSDRSKLRQLIQSFDQLSINNDNSTMNPNIENLGFWYSLNAEALQAVDNWLDDHSKSNGNAEETAMNNDNDDTWETDGDDSVNLIEMDVGVVDETQYQTTSQNSSQNRYSFFSYSSASTSTPSHDSSNHQQAKITPKRLRTKKVRQQRPERLADVVTKRFRRPNNRVPMIQPINLNTSESQQNADRKRYRPPPLMDRHTKQQRFASPAIRPSGMNNATETTGQGSQIWGSFFGCTPPVSTVPRDAFDFKPSLLQAVTGSTTATGSNTIDDEQIMLISTPPSTPMSFIIVDGKPINVNKYLLSAHSEHFRSIFFHQNWGSVIARPGPYQLPENMLNASAFGIFYAFVTTGSKSVGQRPIAASIIEQILDYVSKFPCDYVRREVQEHLLQTAHDKPLGYLIRVAHKHRLLRLEWHCLDVISKEHRNPDHVQSIIGPIQLNNEEQGLIANFIIGKYPWRIPTVRKQINLFRLDTEQALRENGEPEFFQNHALWKQFGAEKVHILVKETIETIHQSQNPRLCLHIGIDGIGLFDSDSDWNVELFMELRLKSRHGAEKDFCMHAYKTFNRNARHHCFHVLKEVVYGQRWGICDTNRVMLNYTFDVHIKGVWQFQREDRFGNGHFSNKYLLGACSRTFRDELFGSSRQYSPNFPVPTASELRLIDSAVNPFCMPKETLNSSSLTPASALELVKLWKKYGIDLLLPIFESFYTQTKDVPFEQQFRIAFAFDIPEMKKRCLNASPSILSNLLQNALGDNSESANEFRDKVVNWIAEHYRRQWQHQWG